LSMKQTLYRTNSDSPVARALLEAAGKKEVTVVVELKASFDEASNIRWARSLEEAGVQVYYGLVGLKTHCKLALVARRDNHGRIRRYAHLGTGNYNPSTARFYTDLSLFTGDEQITGAVHAVFNFLTAFCDHTPQKALFLAPVNLGKNCVSLIEREAAHARAGRPARVVAKVNSLVDPTIIRALYDASQAGVKIDLIVRGGCALRPGVRGLSSNIRVRSVVGRFLEHSRIFVFQNGGAAEVYLGSADWMPRNLYERVEVMFRLKDQNLARQVCQEILGPYLADTRKARLMTPDGSYVRSAIVANARNSRNGRGRGGRARGTGGFDAQQYLISIAEGTADSGSLPPFPVRI
jgi:polyphosphate kinase